MGADRRRRRHRRRREPHATDFETGDGRLGAPARGARAPAATGRTSSHVSDLPPVADRLRVRPGGLGAGVRGQDRGRPRPVPGQPRRLPLDRPPGRRPGRRPGQVRPVRRLLRPAAHQLHLRADDVQWYPAVCPQTGQALSPSPFTSDGFVRYFGGVPTCRRYAGISVRSDLDYARVIDPGAEQMRIALGVVNYCRYYANCTGTTNTTPWFDEVRVAVYGNPNAPLHRRPHPRPSPGRLPGERHPADRRPRPGGLQQRQGTDHSRARHRARRHPGGPGRQRRRRGLGGVLCAPRARDRLAAFNAWYDSHANGVLRKGPWGPEQWKSARMDTAEVRRRRLHRRVLDDHLPRGGSRTSAGTDRDLDPAEQTSHPGRPGSTTSSPTTCSPPARRLNLFYKTRFRQRHRAWFTAAATPPAAYFTRWRCCPSSMDADRHQLPDGMFNCVLYVDHARRPRRAAVSSRPPWAP